MFDSPEATATLIVMGVTLLCGGAGFMAKLALEAGRIRGMLETQVAVHESRLNDHAETDRQQWAALEALGRRVTALETKLAEPA